MNWKFEIVYSHKKCAQGVGAPTVLVVVGASVASADQPFMNAMKPTLLLPIHPTLCVSLVGGDGR